MHQAPPAAAAKPGPKPGVTTAPAVDANATEEQRLFSNRQPLVFDGKRMRKPVARKTIDYNSSVVRYLENRKWFKNLSSRHTIQPDESYATEVLPPFCMMDNPINAVTTKFVRTSTNKLRCPIFCVVWTPEGRRLVTGASSGEFTLWNGLTFNFETILTAHDLPVRSMVWSHNDSWLLSGDHGGVVKYWQSNMNNVQMYEAHKEPIRGLSFSPTDNKYASCADDGLVKIWDFYRCTEEKVLRGHGADVKCIDWHPHKSLLVSGSKDSQQPIKLWDTRTGAGLATLHLHKSTVMSIKWNQNGNWLLTASRDHLLKLFDIRMMKELQSFRGHKREATAIAWHPIHETLFSSGGSDGSIMFWKAGVEKDVGNMESAHDGMVWSLAWHPLGHILCSGSNDHSSKFWTRNRLGDRMRDKYNLNMQDTEDDMGDDYIGVPGFSANHTMAIPGMETTAADPDSMEYDGDYASLPGFRAPQRQTEAFNSPRQGMSEKPVIPGFGPPNAAKPGPQLPPFRSPRKFDDMGPEVPFRTRGDNGFEMQHRPDNPGRKRQDEERPWKPHRQQGFPPEHSQDPRQHHPDDQGPPTDSRDHHGPDGWRPPRDHPHDMENRGGRGNEPRFGPGPNFQRGPRSSRDSFKRGPPGPDARAGILGSPPRGPDGELWPPPPGGRMGLLGSPPPYSGAPTSRAGILGPQPGPDEGERDMEDRREPLSPIFDMHDMKAGHPRDLSSRGFRRGMARGQGPRRGSDLNEERNGENRPRGPPPFQGSRDFKGNPAGHGGRESQGPDDNRRPWPQNSGPVDPRFRRQDDHPDRRPFDRQQPWDKPQDNESIHPRDDMEFRGPPHMEPKHGPRDFVPRDPRAGPHYGRGPPPDVEVRDPRGPPDSSERRLSDDSQRPPENKPRPLMSLMSLSPIVPGPGRNIDLDEPDRPPIQRKRSGDGEHDRERDREWDNNIGPPQKMRYPPGPPEDRRDSRGERPYPDEQMGWRGRGGMR